jgi:SAM-dependent methyltransferase
MSATQEAIDAGNARFWDELCGSALARQLRIEDASADSLRRFDEAYFDLYPYLEQYLDGQADAGRAVLEVGLGYGTVSGRLAELGAELHGLDIAAGPVEMVRHRLRLMGHPADERIVQGSALQMPFANETFDRVYSIGCLHHTGDLPRAVAEVHRVLRPGGRAVVMLYNRHSFRFVVRALLCRKSAEQLRGEYDRDAAGEAAPHTDYVTARQVRALFGGFSRVRVDRRNFDSLPYVPRRVLLGNVDRLVGLDLYIVADR